jgi:hypothetical protein
MRVICLGGRAVASTFAWELAGVFPEVHSAAPGVTGAGWLKSQSWRPGSQDHERTDPR